MEEALVSKTIRPHRSLAGSIALLLSSLFVTSGCAGPAGTTSSSTNPAATVGSCSQVATPFSTDDAAESVNYTDLASTLGPVPAPPSGASFGSVMKFLGNQYW